MRHRLLACCALVLLAACGSKKPPEPPQWNPFSALPPRDENYHGGGAATLRKYDADKDGTLMREELLAGLRAEFAAADTAGSGCLAPAQVAALNQARITADQSTATPLQDWNQDGCVNFQEFATAPVSLFDEMDRDHDGRITPQEFNPAAGRGRGAAGRGRGGPGGGAP